MKLAQNENLYNKTWKCFLPRSLSWNLVPFCVAEEKVVKELHSWAGPNYFGPNGCITDSLFHSRNNFSTYTSCLKLIARKILVVLNSLSESRNCNAFCNLGNSSFWRFFYFHTEVRNGSLTVQLMVRFCQLILSIFFLHQLFLRIKWRSMWI